LSKRELGKLSIVSHIKVKHNLNPIVAIQKRVVQRPSGGTLVRAEVNGGGDGEESTGSGRSSIGTKGIKGGGV